MTLLVALLTVLSLTTPVDWPVVVSQLPRQVARVQVLGDEDYSPGTCSGSVINDKRGLYAGRILTAAHCIPLGGYSLTVNGRDASLVKINRILDLAIIRFTVKDELAIQLATESPKAAIEVCVVGFGFGSEGIAYQFGRVQQSLNPESKGIWLNVMTLFGDSGGPVVDGDGKLVAVTSKIRYNGPASTSQAVRIEDVSDFVDGYLPSRSGTTAITNLPASRRSK